MEPCPICAEEKIIKKVKCCGQEICFNCFKKTLKCPYCRHFNIADLTPIKDLIKKMDKSKSFMMKSYYSFRINLKLNEIYFS